MTTRWLNHVAIAMPRNGTNSHTVDPASGTVVGGTAFTPTAGRALVCVAEGAVTSTTPSGWVLPTNGVALNFTGLYVWHKLVATGGDTITTTHNGSNYPAVFHFLEFPAGSTFKGSAAAANVGSGTAGPALSGMTGITQFFGAYGNSYVGTGTVTWAAGTELVDTSVASSPTDGYVYSLAYLDDSALASWSTAVTPGYTATNHERLVFGIGVPSAPADTTKFCALLCQ